MNDQTGLEAESCRTDTEFLAALERGDYLNPFL